MNNAHCIYAGYKQKVMHLTQMKKISSGIYLSNYKSRMLRIVYRQPFKSVTVLLRVRANFLKELSINLISN